MKVRTEDVVKFAKRRKKGFRPSQYPLKQASRRSLSAALAHATRKGLLIKEGEFYKIAQAQASAADKKPRLRVLRTPSRPQPDGLWAQVRTIDGHRALVVFLDQVPAGQSVSA